MGIDEDYPFLQKKDVQDLTEAIRAQTRLVGTRVEKVEREGQVVLKDVQKCAYEQLAVQREQLAETKNLTAKLEQLLDVLVGKRTNGHAPLAAETSNEGDPL